MRVHQCLNGKKRSDQRHSWLFNLPFVPCCEPQENPVMVAISCVFNMQDTHERTYLALGGDASYSLLTRLQIIIISIRHIEFFSLFVILLSREVFPIHIPWSFTFFSDVFITFFVLPLFVIYTKWISSAEYTSSLGIQAVLFICHSCSTGLVTSCNISTPWIYLQALFHFLFLSLYEI